MTEDITIEQELEAREKDLDRTEYDLEWAKTLLSRLQHDRTDDHTWRLVREYLQHGPVIFPDSNCCSAHPWTHCHECGRKGLVLRSELP